MAIISILEGLQVYISVDGTQLKEYDKTDHGAVDPSDLGVVVEEETTVVKYVEAVDNREFKVVMRAPPTFKVPSPILSFNVIVDGTRVREPLLFKNELQPSGYRSSVDGLESLNGANATLRPLVFRKIQTTDSGFSKDEIKKEAARLSSLGEIVVDIARRHNAKKVAPRNHEFTSKVVGEVHEKALKGKANSHGTTLGTARPITERAIYNTKRMDDQPIATFRFRYRSREALQTLGIIERTPEPEIPALEPEAPPRILSGLSEQERREVEEYIEKQLKEQLKRSIKRERDEDEGTSEPRKKPRKALGKVTIDLTEDDDENARGDSISID